MPLASIDPGVARLSRSMPCWVRRQIIGPGCSPELPDFGMFPWEGQFRDTPPSTSPRWTTDTPPPTPPPTPVLTETGLLLSTPVGGSANLLGTQFINPGTVMAVNASRGAVEFKVPYAISLVGISATMVAALAAGHTLSLQYTIAGVDSAAIVLNLATGQIDGAASGLIAVPLGTAIVVKSTQVGGGGDNIQSLVVMYRA